MSAPDFENLDLACARHAQGLVKAPCKALYKLMAASLSVLEEQGVYALFLFLDSHSDTKNASPVRSALLEFLNANVSPTDAQKPSVATQNGYRFLNWLAEDLDRLLLGQALLRQTLVYARYRAKPDKESEEAA